MLKQLILAGFGGQGVLSMGKILAQSGMVEGKEVTWIPSYGPEMRGGTANCAVTVSTSPINSPLVAEPDILVAMSLPSLEKFEPTVKLGGKVFVNSSLIKVEVKRKDITVYQVPANELADELGEVRIANMVMLGAILATEPIVKSATVLEALKKVLPSSKHHLISLNAQALQAGANVVG